MKPADKFCKYCQQTKSQEHYKRRAYSDHILQTYCIPCTKLRNRLKQQGKLPSASKRVKSEPVRRRIHKVISTLLNNAKPMTKDELVKATNLTLAQTEYIISGAGTTMLFERLRKDNSEKMKYRLSAQGHCTMINETFLAEGEASDNSRSKHTRLLFYFFGITEPRCMPWYC